MQVHGHEEEEEEEEEDADVRASETDTRGGNACGRPLHSRRLRGTHSGTLLLVALHTTYPAPSHPPHVPIV